MVMFLMIYPRTVLWSWDITPVTLFYCFKPPAKYLFKLGEQRGRRDLKQKGTETRKFGNKDLRYRELEL